jgi:hypothetical protein
MDGRFRVSDFLAVPALREASRRRWEDAPMRSRQWAPTILTYDFD